VVYTTFHFPETAANVVTTNYSDWATNCPEYKVTAVQVSRATSTSDWQEYYRRTREQTARVARPEDVAGAPEPAE
jgi:formate dehydrogenase major subunit